MHSQRLLQLPVTDIAVEAHHNSLTRVFPALGQTGATAEILAVME